MDATTIAGYTLTAILLLATFALAFIGFYILYIRPPPEPLDTIELGDLSPAHSNLSVPDVVFCQPLRDSIDNNPEFPIAHLRPTYDPTSPVPSRRVTFVGPNIYQL